MSIHNHFVKMQARIRELLSENDIFKENHEANLIKNVLLNAFQFVLNLNFQQLIEINGENLKREIIIYVSLYNENFM